MEAVRDWDLGLCQLLSAIVPCPHKAWVPLSLPNSPGCAIDKVYLHPTCHFSPIKALGVKSGDTPMLQVKKQPGGRQHALPALLADGGASLGLAGRVPVLAGGVSDTQSLRRGEGQEAIRDLVPLCTLAHSSCAHSSCAERDEWHGCLSRALPEDYKAQALAAFHHSVEVSGGPGTLLTPSTQPWVSWVGHMWRRTCSSFHQGTGFSSHPSLPGSPPAQGQSLCNPILEHRTSIWLCY